jgi:hypothetical protein
MPDEEKNRKRKMQMVTMSGLLTVGNYKVSHP